MSVVNLNSNLNPMAKTKPKRVMNPHQLAKLAEALADFDVRMSKLSGCHGPECLIEQATVYEAKPLAQNEGCACLKNKYTAERVARNVNRLRRALECFVDK